MTCEISFIGSLAAIYSHRNLHFVASTSFQHKCALRVKGCVVAAVGQSSVSNLLVSLLLALGVSFRL